jgi:putative DNA primase/helicase
MYKACPGYAFDAARPGTGKTLLARAAIAIAIGREPAIQLLGKSEEMAKVIMAEALAGSEQMIIDNVTGLIRSPELEAVLTCEGLYRGRILGASTMITCEWCPLIAITGNNLSIGGDLYRRLLLCQMHYEGDSPEKRESFAIEGKLINHILRHRVSLLSDALTVLRAYIHAGMPDQKVRLGSYEDWARLIPSALVWLDMPNVVESQDVLKNAEGSVDERGESMLRALYSTYGTRKIRVSEISEAILTPTAATQNLSMTFRERFDRSELEAKPLGYKLRSLKGRVIKGAQLICDIGHTKTAKWGVKLAEGQTLIEPDPLAN